MGSCFSKELHVSTEQKMLISHQRSAIIILPETPEYDENGRLRLRIKIPGDG